MSDQQYMTNFTGEDMKISYAKDSPPPPPDEQSQSQASQQSAPPPDANEPPDGTSKEVLDWVGDDKDRAQAALDKEQSNEKPRVTLIADLEKVRDAEDEDDK